MSTPTTPKRPPRILQLALFFRPETQLRLEGVMLGMRSLRLLCSSISRECLTFVSALPYYHHLLLRSALVDCSCCFTDHIPLFTKLTTSPCSGSFENVQLSPPYFDRQDVKEAIHAPINCSCSECSDLNVFPSRNSSLPFICDREELSPMVWQTSFSLLGGAHLANHHAGEFSKSFALHRARIVIPNMTCQ